MLSCLQIILRKTDPASVSSGSSSFNLLKKRGGRPRGMFPGVGRALTRPARQASQNRSADYRLLRMGTFISSGLISRTSSGTPQANAGSTLILKWYMLCIA